MRKGGMLVLVLVLMFLGGCATEEELAAEDAARCESFGFEAGTEAFANCRLHLYALRNRRPDVIERPFFPPPPRVIVVPERK